MKALAVVRSDREEATAFRRIMDGVLRRLEPLSEREPVRWHTLVRFVLSWAFWRRPARERRQLVRVAQQSQSAAAHREEMRKVSETIDRTWPEELLAEGMAQGRAEGELRTCRRNLRLVLEERFGAVPEALAQQIEQLGDLERLESSIRQALRIQELAQLKL
jgi:hypothetical protein